MDKGTRWHTFAIAK